MTAAMEVVSFCLSVDMYFADGSDAGRAFHYDFRKQGVVANMVIQASRIISIVLAFIALPKAVVHNRYYSSVSFGYSLNRGQSIIHLK
jgi:hypothetical protein